MKNSPLRVLLTTPDYPPKIGGLSTFTLSIEGALRQLGIEYELFHWSSLSELKSFSAQKKYDLGIHIHFMGSHYLSNRCEEHINFVHGSEILFTSPNFLKRAYKKLTKKLFLRRLEKSLFNISISEFTLSMLQNVGLRVDYSRDIIFHNCISLAGRTQFVEKKLDSSVLKFICVARDVPHKNLDGAYRLCEIAAEVLERPVELYATKEFKVASPLVTCHSIAGIGDDERDQLFKECHFNLLLSEDHSNRGFYEGFGLTVLEAGKFGTPSIVSLSGGLPESCHHNITGWSIPSKESAWRAFFRQIEDAHYQNISRACYEHTLTSHGSEHYVTLLRGVLKKCL